MNSTLKRTLAAATIAVSLGLGTVACIAVADPAKSAERQAPPAATVGRVPAATADLKLKAVAVDYLKDLNLLVFEQRVEGAAGGTKPDALGRMDGAPVTAYVFRTTLKPEDIGFGATDGLVALAVTSHPDFDDSPLWDENNDGRRDNDGATYHSHWVVLVPDARAPGGLAVKEFKKGAEPPRTPSTHPGLPLYLDSPGHSVVLAGDTLRVLVPADRVNGRTDFAYDGVTAFLRHAHGGDAPLLGVAEVYSAAAGKEPTAYKVRQR
jgi:hypothetical protein